MNKYADIEQKIADELFKRHGRVLDKGAVDGVSVGVEFVEEIAGGKTQSWSFRRNGKVQVRVGARAYWVTSERSVGFKQLKGGGHNYDKIADKLVEMADYVAAVEKRRAETRKVERGNRDFIKDMEKKYNLFSYGSGLEANHNTGALLFKVRPKTQEQAEKLLKLAIDMGLVTSKEMVTL